MLKYFQIVTLFAFGCLMAQVKKGETVYFDFDKYTINKEQEQLILDFIQKKDTATIESIRIYGYCDDRGTDNYNYKLSENRVNTVKKILISNGFNKNKIVIFEGRGRVVLENNVIDNLEEIRSKNRRVDLFIVRKNSFGKGLYNSFQEQHEVGDRIYLENIFFAIGSSKLTPESKQELDEIAEMLKKNKGIEFEIRGHVCCTPKYYNDAIDHDTNERNLSYNRAKTVFRYLISRNINSLRMSYKGLGNQFPLGKGEEYDRRVEFLITKI